MRVRRLLNIFVNISLMAVMYAALLGIGVWLTGQVFSDRYEWSQWIAWTPTPVAIVVALIGFTATWRNGGGPMRKRVRRIGWGTTVLALIVFFCFIEHRLLTTGDCAAPGLKIVHWNSTGVPNEHEPATAAWLAELDGDVTILTNHGGMHRKPAIHNWLTDNGVIVRPQPFAILSKLPIVEVRTVVSSQQMHVVILRLNATEKLGRELTLWLIDLPSDPETPRMETATQVRQWIDESDLPAADIILGDFNMTRGSASLDVIAPEYRHAFDVAGSGFGATYPRDMPWLHIDHILIGDAIEPKSYCIIDPGVGSHRLQMMTIPEASHE